MTEFITLTMIGLMMIISPGPDFAIVTKTSIANGRLAGLGSAVGIGLANCCHVSLNLLGIGLIIAESTLLFNIMKILGATYLIYIGYKGLRAKPNPRSASEENQNNPHINHDAIDLNKGTIAARNMGAEKAMGRIGFFNGFITSLLNPKACLFFLSFFSVLLPPDTALKMQVFYGAWLSFLALLWFTLVAVFFTNPIIGSKLKEYKHWIERVAGGALMILGIKLLSTKGSF